MRAIALLSAISYLFHFAFPLFSLERHRVVISVIIDAKNVSVATRKVRRVGGPAVTKDKGCTVERSR